jgi:hypothetical protein
MSGKERAVLWMGLILIALNLAKRWKDIRDIIFSGAKAVAAPAQQAPQTPNPSIQIPIDPFLPTGPKITIPLPNL